MKDGRLHDAMHGSEREPEREQPSPERWASVFEHAGWGIAISSADGRALEHVNPAFARMHGYAVAELIGRPIVEVFAPEARARLPEELRLAHERGRHAFESVHLRKGGTTFPVRIDVTVVSDAAGRLLYRAVHVQDITEQKRAEQVLAASTAALEAASRASRVASRVLLALSRQEEPALALAGALDVLASEAGYRPLALYGASPDGGFALEAALGLAPGAAKRRLAPGEGLVGECAARRAPVVIEGPAEGGFALDTGVGVIEPRALFALPLVHGDALLGVLAGAAPRGLAAPEREGLPRLADQVAIGVHTLRQLERLRALSAELQERNRRIDEQNRELREQQEELRAQQEELRRATEDIDRFFSLPLGLLVMAGVDGYFKRVNPAWERTLGFTTAELLARPYLDFVHPDDRRPTEDKAEGQRTSAGSVVMGFRNRYRCRDGSYRSILWHSISVPEREMIYAIGLDVTDRIAAERALEAKQAEVEAATRAKSDFLANMSHELRTPLNAVLGFSELLLAQASARLAPRHVQWLEDIRASGRHLLALINDILDLSKIEAGRLELDLERVEPGEALRDARAFLAAEAQKRRVAIVQEASGPTGEVLADRQRLRQVLLNLLSNAIKFSPEGAEVRVGAEHAGAAVRFWVRDDGPGIAAEVEARLFQAFVQGEGPLVKQHAGTGLGLAIVKRLVEQHAGAVGVDTAPGRGATFSFTIPLAAAAAAARAEPRAQQMQMQAQPPIAALARVEATPAPARPLDAPGAPARAPRADAGSGGAERPLSILVIDDDPRVEPLLRSILEPAGFAVRAAASGRAGIEAALGDPPDLAIVDLRMPDVPGAEVVAALAASERTRGCPILALTAADLSPAERAALRPRVLAIAEKGETSSESLLAIVRRALGLPQAAAGLSGTTLVLADDQDLNREVARAILEERGYRVLLAEDGAQAVALARDARPAVIVLDLAMPVMDGFAAARALRADPATAAIPLLALTAMAMRSDEERARAAGFDAYVTKPIDRARLEAELTRLLAVARERGHGR